MFKTPLSVFCSSSPEDAALCQQLRDHLLPLEREGWLTVWHNRLITPGTDWAKALDQQLTGASIILLLISSSFFASDYCYGVEMQLALKRHQAGEARVIPILLKPVDWHITRFAYLQALPTKGRPVTLWRNRDAAFTNIATHIRRIIEEIVSHSESTLSLGQISIMNSREQSQQRHIDIHSSFLEFNQLTEVEDGGKTIAHLDHFQLGTLKSTWIVVDGNGVDHYLPQNIRTYFEPTRDILPRELAERRNAIGQLQEANRERGLPFHWNGERYSLNRFILSRSSSEEELALDLWFRPSDYNTFLATNMSLNDEALRSAYLQHVDWSKPVPFFSNSFGIYLLVITSDNVALFTRRSANLGSRPGEYNISLCEGLGAMDAASTRAPDLYKCAERGLMEELGLQNTEDFTLDDMHFLSLGVDTLYAQWGLLGIVKINKTSKKVGDYRRAGVKDKLENDQVLATKFELEEIVPFVLAHGPWAPGGLACLYHALVHEFGRSKVELALETCLHSEGDFSAI